MPAFGEEKPNAARSKKMNSRRRLLDSCGMRVRRSICTCVYERRKEVNFLAPATNHRLFKICCTRVHILSHSSLRIHRHLQRSSIVMVHVSGFLKRRGCVPSLRYRKKFYKRTKAAQLLSQSRRSVKMFPRIMTNENGGRMQRARLTKNNVQ